MIYNALLLSRINYGILAWGYNSEKITLAKLNTHSETILKSLNLLKV